MRPRTRNFASSDETWNFTVRSDRFRLLAISLFARLFISPQRTFFFPGVSVSLGRGLILPRLQELVRFRIEAVEEFFFGLDHHNVIAR